MHKPGRADPETLRLVTAHQGRKVPTVSGMLLFSQNRELHFPTPGFRPAASAAPNESRSLRVLRRTTYLE